MTFTVRSYSSMPKNASNWVKQPTSEKAGYDKYIEKGTKNSISKCKSANLTIIFFEIITFGIYYFLKSKTDSTNIKEKTLVYYVKASSASKTSSKTHTTANKKLPPDPLLVNGHQQTSLQAGTQANPPSQRVSAEPLPSLLTTLLQESAAKKAKVEATAVTTKAQPKNPLTLKEQIRTLLSEAAKFRTIRKNLDEVLKSKKETFFLHLGDKNIEMAEALAKFYDNKKNTAGENQIAFLEALQPFFEKVDVKKVLENAIENTQNSERALSEADKKFKSFKQKYGQLEDPCDWLLSLSSNPKQYEMGTILIKQFETHWQGNKEFSSLYKDHKELVEACIKKMDTIALGPEEKKIKEDARDTFARGKEVNSKLIKKIEGTNYSAQEVSKSNLKDSSAANFENVRNKFGLDLNKMGPDFLKGYLKHGQKAFDETYASVERELKNHQSYLKDIAQTWQRIAEAKKAREKALLGSKEVIQGFNDIKAFHKKNKDLISILSEASKLTALFNLGEIKMPVDYLKALSDCSYMLTYNEPSIPFYKSFNMHFSNYKEHHAAILEIEKMAKKSN